MPKWNGGVIGVANNPTQSSAKGIWSLSEATKAIRAGLWPPSNAGADPYFENVTLLLPGDGTNGAQNNTFLDSSTNNFTITRNGNTTQGTFTPFSKVDGRWGNYFDGNGDYLDAGARTAFAFGTGSWTVEAWVYVNSLASEILLFDTRSSASTAGVGCRIATDGTLSYSGSANNALTTSAITTNTWNHIAWVYDGTTLSGYINGVRGGTATPSFNISQNNGVIGRVGFSAAGYMNGYISNLRVLKGSAAYSGTSFTTPTAPLTAITNTSLLTCQSNRFIDNSTNAFAITRNGDVSVQTFSPFTTLTAYAAGTNGGSGYFDGSGDYLSIGTQTAFGVGTGACTIEAWFYPTATGSYQGIISTRATSSNLGLCINNSNVFEFTIGTSVITSTAYQLNAWNHAVGVRSTVGGTTTASLFINGTRVATSTSLTGDDGSTRECVVGRYYTDTANYYFTGWIAGARILKGTAAYDPTQSTLTIPTAPATNVSNTSVLFNFTNGGIIDTSMSNDLETVGNAQISTTQSKFGGASMYFDGTGDYLVAKGTSALNVGAGDFTIEGWFYTTSASTQQAIVNAWNSIQFQVEISSSGKVQFAFAPYSTGSYLIVGNTTISANTWYHFAVVRSGSTFTLYLNGTSDGTGTSSATTSTNVDLWVGANYGGTRYLNGYIDDLRITKGYARYTANFTAPVGPFNGFGD
jgi:hypothetical protein